MIHLCIRVVYPDVLRVYVGLAHRGKERLVDDGCGYDQSYQVCHPSGHLPNEIIIDLGMLSLIDGLGDQAKGGLVEGRTSEDRNLLDAEAEVKPRVATVAR